MDEKEIIRRILEALPSNSNHLNDFFASDSEILDIGGKRILFTIDSFSAEDHFRTDNPYVLGGNLAACTVSDIFACGGQVLHVGHSVTLAQDWDADYIQGLSRGIADVVSACGGCFAGGDIGRSTAWQYTGVALGVSDRIITRKGAQPGDHLYLSGELGAGNFEAAFELLPRTRETSELFDSNRVSFPIRCNEARLIARYANACIDTSDGVLNALHTLSEVNGTGFRIDTLPYYAPGRILLETLGLALELLLAGECGEYELLCCIPPEREQDFLADARSSGFTFHRLGSVTESRIAVLHKNTHSLDLSDFTVCAREFRESRDYLHALIEYFERRSCFTSRLAGES